MTYLGAMKRAWIILFSLPVAGWIAFCAWYFSRFNVEDAFIVSRYARNFVEWGELTFNRGEHVNALTSPLHTFIKVFCYLLPGNETVYHKIFSVLALCFTIYAGWKKLDDLRERFLFIILTACSPYLWLWTYGGLETPWLGCLLMLFLLEAWKTDKLTIRMGIWGGLMMITRMDMVLVILPVITWRLYRTREYFPAVVAAVFPVLWIIFSLYYYHDILPTSFYVKLVQDEVNYALEPTLDAVYILQFFLFTGLLLLIGAALFQTRKIFRDRRHIWLAAGIYICLYGFFAGREHMLFAFRLFVPWIVPLAFLLLKEIALPSMRKTIALGGIIFALQFSGASVMNSWSLDTTAFNEYKNWNFQDYRHCFIDRLPVAAEIIGNDWIKNPDHSSRTPRLCTFAGGLLPYRLPDFYVYETLVSYRKDQPWEYKGTEADYYHILVARDKPVPEVFRDTARYEILWKDECHESWPVTMYIIRNNRPETRMLPRYVK